MFPFGWFPNSGARLIWNAFVITVRQDEAKNVLKKAFDDDAISPQREWVGNKSFLN